MHIEWLEKRLEKIEKDMGRRIQKSPVWRVKGEILCSMKGVGPGLCRFVVSDLPELRTLKRQKISALVGVAPLSPDSGKFRGRRTTWGGRDEKSNSLGVTGISKSSLTGNTVAHGLLITNRNNASQLNR